MLLSFAVVCDPNCKRVIDGAKQIDRCYLSSVTICSSRCAVFQLLTCYSLKLQPWDRKIPRSRGAGPQSEHLVSTYIPEIFFWRPTFAATIAALLRYAIRLSSTPTNLQIHMTHSGINTTFAIGWQSEESGVGRVLLGITFDLIL